MSGLQITVTQAGRAALVNAANTGTLPVQITAIGVTPQAFTPAATHTALPGEIKRLPTFAGAVVADDTIHVTIRDDGPDTYTLRGFGLYLQDGTLFAVYSQAGVILEKSTQAMLLLAVDVRFVEVPATSLAFGDASFINPPATTEVQGVVELATAAETVAGGDSVRAVTPFGMKAALDARLGAGAPTSFSRTLLAAGLAADHRSLLGLGSAALRHEGHGGGLDADLLDGHHGSYYLAWGNLTGVPATASRWPEWSEVTGKPTTFTPAAHTHAWGDLSGVPATASRWPEWSEVTGKPETFPPASHGHSVAEIAGLTSLLDAKVNRSGDTMTGQLYVPSLGILKGPVGTQQILITGAHEDGVARIYQVIEADGGYSIYLLTPDGLPAPNSYRKLYLAQDAGVLSVLGSGVYFSGHEIWHAQNFNPDAKATLGAAVGFHAVSVLSGDLSTAASRFYFDKQVQANGGFQVFSSRLTKQDIEPIAPDLATLRALRPVRYRYRDEFCPDRRIRLGLIAEDVASVLPEPVVTHGDRPPTLDYDQLAAPIIAWLQLLDARLTNLETAYA